MTDSFRSQDRPAITWKLKTVLYAAAWIAALFATNPSGNYWTLAYIFPLGLAGFINLRWGNDGGWWVLGACAAVYLIHAWFYFRSHTRRSMLGVFAVLVL